MLLQGDKHVYCCAILQSSNLWRRSHITKIFLGLLQTSKCMQLFTSYKLPTFASYRRLTDFNAMDFVSSIEVFMIQLLFLSFTENCWYTVFLFLKIAQIRQKYMMTSSNGNISRLTGPLCGEFIGHRWIPHKVQWRRALMFSLIFALHKQLSKQS